MATSAQKIIVVGGGGHAKVLLSVLLRLPQYEVIGFIDDNEAITDLLGFPRLGGITKVNTSLETKTLALGLGHVGNLSFYKRVIELYTSLGFSFATIIAPTAFVSPFATIGKGVAIADGVIIQPGAVLNDYVIINTNASVDHDTVIGSYTHVAPGCAISGAVHIGSECLLGTGSAVIQGITITDGCVIGAGASVVTDCLVSGVYVGVPAEYMHKK